MKRNLLVICPTRHDATSFYRGFGPLGRLRHLLPDVNFIMSEGIRIDWSTMRMTDGIFMQRPFLKDHLTIMQMAKENNVPVWVDYDDDLFNLPSDNPAYELYNDQNIQKNIAQIIAMAAFVSVSTSPLYERLRALNKNVTIIQNALDDSVFNDSNFKRKQGAQPSKVVAWRGSATHVRDLMTYTQEIIEVINTHPDWVFAFVGYKPWFITDNVKNKRQIVAYDAMDIMEYHRTLFNIWPAILHVPLHFNKFNEAKSNIAWIEGTFFGAACVTPKMPEWPGKGRRYICSQYYSNPVEYRVALEGLMAASDEERKGLVNNSMEEIPRLSVENLRRKEILEVLLGL